MSNFHHHYAEHHIRLHDQKFGFDMHQFHQHAMTKIHLADESPSNWTTHQITIYNHSKNLPLS